MRHLSKLAVVVCIAILLGCSTTKPRETTSMAPPTPRTSYRLPARHKEIHEQLLRNQQKLYTISLEVDSVKLPRTTMITVKE